MAQRGAETVRLIFFCVSHMHGSVALTLFSSPPFGPGKVRGVGGGSVGAGAWGEGARLSLGSKRG